MGASVAGAGLVAMAVFIIARRKARQSQLDHDYKKQLDRRSLDQQPPPGAADQGPGGGGAYARAVDAYNDDIQPVMVQGKMGTWVAEKGVYEVPLNHPSVQRLKQPSELDDTMSLDGGDGSSMGTGTGTGTWRSDANGNATWSSDVDAAPRSPGMKQMTKSMKMKSLYELA